MRSLVRMRFLLAVGALVLAACGSSGAAGDEHTVTVACASNMAFHDFGTTDPATLASVRAFAYGGTACGPTLTGEDVEVYFDGSKAEALCGCNSGNAGGSYLNVTFVY
jgi:hypothetical protein